MSAPATTAAPTAPRGPGPAAAARHARLLAGRNLLTISRRPDVITFIVVQPIMFTLLFVYVFGGAIQVPSGDYVNFLMPGVIVQTLVFDAPVTAIGLNDDLGKGVLDRFRSLPIARSAVLTGRLLADAVRALTVLGVIIAIGYAVGFRFQNGVLAALAAVALAWLFALGIAWGSAIIGLLVPTPEAVQAAVFTALFPLVFASSVFVPVATMPGWLQAFAKVNPVSIVTDAVRGLARGGPVATDVVASLGWSAGLIVVLAPIAIARYRRLP